MHDVQNTTSEKSSADGTCASSLSGKKKKKKKKPLYPSDPPAPLTNLSTSTNGDDKDASYVFEGLSLMNENDVAAVTELLVEAFSAPQNLYAKLYGNDRVFLQRHFLYYLRQAQQWYMADKTLTFFGLRDAATGGIVAVTFIVPPERRWDAELCSALDNGDGRLIGYETFYDDLFDSLGPKLGEAYLYLLLLAVDGRRGRRGLGSTMVKHAVAMAEARACALVLDTSDAGLVPYYAKFGFHVVAESAFTFKFKCNAITEQQEYYTDDSTTLTSPLWILRK